MSIADYSIRRPVFAWVLMIGLIFFGALGFSRLGVSLMPDVNFPVLQIQATWEGAAPEYVEAELADQIEQRVISVEGLKEVRSEVRQGQATIKLEFDLGRDIDAAMQEVESAIARVKLPLNVDPPVVRKSNPEEEPIIFVGISSPRPLRELIRVADLLVNDQIQTVKGVGEVQFMGFTDRNLRVWVDNEKLRHYQLTVLDVVRAIGLEHVEYAAGRIENSSRDVNVRTLGEGTSPEEVGNILISQRGGLPLYDAQIRIKDVARVEDGLNDIRRIARMAGQTGINIAIKKLRGSNEVEVARRVRQRIGEIQKTLPPDVNMQVSADFTGFTRQAVDRTQHELLISVILTSLVCYLFLGSWRSAINVVLAIPTSIVGSFLVVYFCGFTLNTFTLLALTLSIGIVVDDAIMMLENIVRHLHKGLGRVEAARTGAREITFAAIAATVAVVAIFLPVVFMEGMIGKFFFQFGVTMSAAVLLSLLEAVTLTPMRCSQFLADKEERPGRFARGCERLFDALSRAYRRALEVALNWRWTVLGAATALFVLSLGIVFLMRIEFVPNQDQSFLRVRLETPVGSSLAFTDEETRKVEAYLDKRKDVDKYYVVVGSSSDQPNQAALGVTLVDKSKRKLGQSAFIKQVREDLRKVTRARVTFSDISTRGLTSGRIYPFAVNIRGPDQEVLKKKSAEMIERLRKSGLVTDLDVDYREGQPELRIIPDREAAFARGVSMENIGQTINAAIGGIRQGKYSSDGRRYDVRVRLEAGQRLMGQDVHKLQVRTFYGELVPMTDVVRLEEVPTVQSIYRINRQRSISVFGNIAVEKSQATALEMARKIAAEILPENYSMHFEGGAQAFQESRGSLLFALLVGVLVAYLVLASQFDSFVHPVITLLALPFSVSGALAALYLAGQSLNLYSMVGLLLLMGIVKKNSILLVEFTNRLRFDQGLPLREAQLQACPIRLRPILMTSLATIAAAIPPAVGLGAGSETRVPMAVAVIGGVFVSTIFTLFVVPCAYNLATRLERARRRG